jgi:hypothetical protein
VREGLLFCPPPSLLQSVLHLSTLCSTSSQCTQHILTILHTRTYVRSCVCSLCYRCTATVNVYTTARSRLYRKIPHGRQRLKEGPGTVSLPVSMSMSVDIDVDMSCSITVDTNFILNPHTHAHAREGDK